MHTVLTLLFALLPLTAGGKSTGQVLDVDQEPGAAAPGGALIEMHLDVRDPRPNQAVRVTLTFGMEDAFRQDHLVSFFPRPLDFPVQVRTPGWEELTDCQWQWLEDSSAGEDELLSLAWNGQQVHCRLRHQDRDGRRYAMGELTFQFRFAKAGRIDLPPAALLFQYSQDVATDYLGNPIARDPQRHRLSADPLEVRVDPFPLAGQPADFHGAIGPLELSTNVKQLRVAAGSPLRVELRIGGTGWLEGLTAPDLSALAEFHLLGQVESLADAAERVFLYDLAAREEGVRVLPAIELPFWDPTAAEYRIAASAPISIEVLPGSGVVSVATPESTDPTSESAGQAAQESEHPSATQRRDWIGILIGAVLLFLGGVLFQGMRQRVAAYAAADSHPVTMPYAAAQPPFAAAPAAADDLSAAQAADEACEQLHQVLCAHLQCTRPSLVDPRLAQRLQSCGWPAPMAGEAAQLIESATARGYGGPHPADLQARCRALLEQIPLDETTS